MKRYVLAALVFYSFVPLKGQDYVLTWKNDTIPCVFPGKPGKEGVRPAANYENGHIRVLTFFPNDSVRAVEAGQIRAYNREKHGRGLLCNGYFESRKISETDKKHFGSYHNRGGAAWYFMRRLVAGRYLSLYMIYLRDGKYIPSFYFIGRNDSEPVLMIRGKKEIIQLLSDNEEIATALGKIKFRKPEKGYTDIANEYNRLKEIAALSK